MLPLLFGDFWKKLDHPTSSHTGWSVVHEKDTISLNLNESTEKEFKQKMSTEQIRTCSTQENIIFRPFHRTYLVGLILIVGGVVAYLGSVFPWILYWAKCVVQSLLVNRPYTVLCSCLGERDLPEKLFKMSWETYSDKSLNTKVSVQVVVCGTTLKIFLR